MPLPLPPCHHSQSDTFLWYRFEVIFSALVQGGEPLFSLIYKVSDSALFISTALSIAALAVGDPVNRAMPVSIPNRITHCYRKAEEKTS